MEPGEQGDVRRAECEGAEDVTALCIQIFGEARKEPGDLILEVMELVRVYGNPNWRKVLWNILVEGDTPLYCIRFIIDQGVNPNIGMYGEDDENAVIELVETIVYQHTPFSNAMQERVTFLIEKGANINVLDRSHSDCSQIADILNTLLSPNEVNGSALDDLTFLVGVGANLNRPNYNGVIGGPGKTPLMYAVGLRDPDHMLERVKLLLSLGADCGVSYTRDKSTGNLITPCDRVRKRIERDRSKGEDVGVLEQVLLLLEGGERPRSRTDGVEEGDTNGFGKRPRTPTDDVGGCGDRSDKRRRSPLGGV